VKNGILTNALTAFMGFFAVIGIQMLIEGIHGAFDLL